MEQKDKDNKPIIPTLRESANKPQLKIKGLAQGGMSLIERLKQFKKKDLAFIMAGLGVLFMAPLAEHFMMSPESGEPAFGQGISSRDGKSSFGSSSSPYETGGSSLAPGAAIGANGDVITPLNVRDPSALVMGPGATQQPAAGSVAPPAPPEKKESGDWKDALANAGASAAKAATKHASLPVPKVPISGGGLRGLGAISGGGSGANFSGGISAAGVPNKAAQSNSLGNIRAAKDYKGIAARGPGSGAGGGFDALKRAAANQASDFNRNGSASASLDQAASRNMGGGDAFGGASGESNGKEDKGPGGNQGKDSKSVGESLEFLRQKAEQDHAIDLEWKLKEKAAMRIPNLEDKIMEEEIMTPLKAITGGIADFIKNAGKKGSGTMACTDPSVDPTGANPFVVNASDIADTCGATQGGQEQTTGAVYCYCNTNQDSVCKMPGNQKLNCNGKSGAGPASTSTVSGVGGGNRPPGGAASRPSAAATAATFNQSCQQFDVYKNRGITGANGQVTRTADIGDNDAAVAHSYANAVVGVNNANFALTGNGGAGPACSDGAAPSADQGSGVQNLLNDVQSSLYGAKPNGVDATSVLGKDQTTNTAAGSALKQFTSAAASAGTQADAAQDAAQDAPQANANSGAKSAWETDLETFKTDLDAQTQDATKLNADYVKLQGDYDGAKEALDALTKAIPVSNDQTLLATVNQAENNLVKAKAALDKANDALALAEGNSGVGASPSNASPANQADFTKYKGQIQPQLTQARADYTRLNNAYQAEKAAADKLRDALVTPIESNAGQTQTLLTGTAPQGLSGAAGAPNASNLKVLLEEAHHLAPAQGETLPGAGFEDLDKTKFKADAGTVANSLQAYSQKQQGFVAPLRDVDSKFKTSADNLKGASTPSGSGDQQLTQSVRRR